MIQKVSTVFRKLHMHGALALYVEPLFYHTVEIRNGTFLLPLFSIHKHLCQERLFIIYKGGHIF